MMPENSSSHLLEAKISDISFTIIAPAIGVVSSVTCIILLNTFLQNLHQILKSLINLLCIHNLLAFGLAIGFNILMLITNYQTLEICFGLHEVFCNSVYITVNSLTLLSYMRFYITKNTDQAESIDKAWLFKITLTVYASEYLFSGPVVYFGSKYLNLPSTIAACAGKNLQGPPIITLFQIIRLAVALIIGLIYDKKLIEFLKKKNQAVGPGQCRLIPWKSGGDHYSILVPASASLAATTSFCFVTAVCIFIIKVMIGNSEISQWKVVIFILSIIVSVNMPVILGLTIRAALKEKPKPHISKTLNFHDDSEEITNQENIQECEIEPKAISSRIIKVKPINKELEDVENHI